MNREYIVIGVANNSGACCTAEAKAVLPQYTVFSGGERHYALVKHLLPATAPWITIRGDMPALFAQYQQVQGPLVIFASGDPLFYGMVQTIRKYDPGANVSVYPHFNSIQRLCAKTGISYEYIKNTSVHGRGWQELDAALIKGEPLIAVLTDAVRHPQAIAQRMGQYGFANYEMIVGEDLDGPAERIFNGSLTEAAERNFHLLNCVLLRQNNVATSPGFGIADTLFEGLPGRPNMITKKAIRLSSLSQLQLQVSTTFWDIGFCTGAVAIEARRLFSHLQVLAFEKRAECEGIMNRNMQQLSAPGITVLMGDFFEQPLQELPAPDAVFIGGHGNQLPLLMQTLDTYMRVGGRVVMNAVLESSSIQFAAIAEKLSWQLLPSEVLQVNDHNPITLLTAIKTA